MRLRTRQLACLLVLLSTLGLTAGASEPSSPGFRGTAIEALLYRNALENHAAEPATKPSPSARVDESKADLPAAERSSLQTAWPVSAASANAATARAVQSYPAQLL